MDLKLADFLYELPEDRIAKYPPKNRQDSRLLCYSKNAISHHKFGEITDLLPEKSLLVFNDTRVIPARVILKKETGARIEIFLLEPTLPSTVHEAVMKAHSSCTWKCMIGNARKWKRNISLFHETLQLKATRTAQDEVTFEWRSGLTFSDILTEAGKIPLPPYLNRETEDSDEERYQTVYSKMDGAVAAPTAGLHFTDQIIDSIEKRGIRTDYLTLHVSAGTFQPVKSEKISEHDMHNEQIWVSLENVRNILEGEKIIAVGTTAMRTMESLYWFGVKLLNGYSDFFIEKSDAYTLKPSSKKQSLEAVYDHMKKSGLSKIGGQTEIFIYPGYKFRICQGLVTNYHLPGSTLILLVAAFVGDDWKLIYNEALKSNYRFLSYGDSSLLLP